MPGDFYVFENINNVYLEVEKSQTFFKPVAMNIFYKLERIYNMENPQEHSLKKRAGQIYKDKFNNFFTITKVTPLALSIVVWDGTALTENIPSGAAHTLWVTLEPQFIIEYPMETNEKLPLKALSKLTELQFSN